jgi:hypothetical protein
MLFSSLLKKFDKKVFTKKYGKMKFFFIFIGFLQIYSW